MAGQHITFSIFADNAKDAAGMEDMWDHCYFGDSGLNARGQILPKIVEKIVEKKVIVEKLIQPKWEDVQGEDEEISESEKPCVICMTNKPQCVLMPCMHCGFCIDCVNHLQKTKKCPLCREKIYTPRKLYS